MRMTRLPLFLCLILFTWLTAGSTPKIKVHLVSHTHDDTGWLKTVDQYYMGMNNTIQFAGVQYIIDSVVAGLRENPNRKFTYVEIAFFARWWDEQSEATKGAVRQLVANGQLQFANGGWCMHDEANPHFIDMIDQTTLGHQFLKKELNAVPLVGWQIDPFGHSATNAALLSARVGFKAIYFGRADYTDYAFREATLSREFWWQASTSMPTATVFGGILLTNHYGPPSHFNWDVISPNREPVQDDPRLEGFNVQRKIDLFVERANHDATVTRGHHVMWTMGDDFRYQDANFWFKNIDKMIKYVNQDGRVEATYSTPYEYTAAKLTEAGITYPNITGDFFPYRDNQYAFWTGYFTSRPALKRYIRQTSSYYSVSRQVQAIAGIYDASADRTPLAEAMALVQHHDAVTGTSKQHVAFDYAKRLAAGTTYDTFFFQSAWQGLNTYFANASVVVCFRQNQSECSPLDSTADDEGFVLLLWNGLPYPRFMTAEVPVFDPSSWQIDSASILAPAYFPSRQPVTNYALSNPLALPWTIGIVTAVPVPPLGFIPVKFTRVRSPPSAARRGDSKPSSSTVGQIGSGILVSKMLSTTGFVTYTFRNAFTGFTVSTDPTVWLQSIDDVVSSVSVQVQQEWCYYVSNTGDSFSGQASGAYIFRPAPGGHCSAPCPSETVANVTLVENSKSFVVIERQVCSWISERLVLSAADRRVKHQFTVGPIPDEFNMQGREVVSRFHTDLDTGSSFFTDSNGRELLNRTLNYRATWPFTQSEPIAGNYYPVNTLAHLKGSDGRGFAVAVDSSVGGASLASGKLELMVHRRILQDDGRGVGEPLNETQFISPYSDCGYFCGQHFGPPLIVRGEHQLIVGIEATISQQYRDAMDEVYWTPPLLVLKDVDVVPSPVSFWPLPVYPNLQLVTLQRLNASHALLRLGHKYAAGEGGNLSQPLHVDVCQLCRGLKWNFDTIQETTLTTNQNIGLPILRNEAESCTVTINAMDIRTFLISIVTSIKQKK